MVKAKETTCSLPLGALYITQGVVPNHQSSHAEQANEGHNIPIFTHQGDEETTLHTQRPSVKYVVDTVRQWRVRKNQ